MGGAALQHPLAPAEEPDGDDPLPPLVPRWLSTRPEFWFSRIPRAAASALCGVEDAGAEQVKAGPPVHRSLDHLEPVDLSLDGACRLRQIDGGLHSRNVLAQFGYEASKRGGGSLIEDVIKPIFALSP
jgi:hypothetical protein